jgi:hypothetical protein
MTRPALLTKRAPAQAGGAQLALCVDRADFQNRREFDQLGFVLVGMVLAEEQLGP